MVANGSGLIFFIMCRSLVLGDWCRILSQNLDHIARCDSVIVEEFCNHEVGGQVGKQKKLKTLVPIIHGSAYLWIVFTIACIEYSLAIKILTVLILLD